MLWQMVGGEGVRVAGLVDPWCAIGMGGNVDGDSSHRRVSSLRLHAVSNHTRSNRHVRFVRCSGQASGRFDELRAAALYVRTDGSTEAEETLAG